MPKTRGGMAVGLSLITALTVPVVPAGAAPAAEVTAQAPASGRVPVPTGRYGDAFGTEMMMFTVKRRTIIDPRVAITVDCRHSDGTTSTVDFGPTQSDRSRRFRVPADGNGRISWEIEQDVSLIRNARVEVGYTFRRNRRTLASVEVRARYSEPDPAGGTWTSTCHGYFPFRLDYGPLRPAAA